MLNKTKPTTEKTNLNYNVIRSFIDHAKYEITKIPAGCLKDKKYIREYIGNILNRYTLPKAVCENVEKQLFEFATKYASMVRF